MVKRKNYLKMCTLISFDSLVCNKLSKHVVHYTRNILKNWSVLNGQEILSSKFCIKYGFLKSLGGNNTLHATILKYQPVVLIPLLFSSRRPISLMFT